MIVKKTDGLTGGSDVSMLGVGSKEASNEDADEDAEEGGKQGEDERGEDGEDHLHPTNLFNPILDIPEVINTSFHGDGGVDQSVLASAATESTAPSSHTSITAACTSGGKQPGTSKGEGVKKKSKAFSQPLHIPRKSLKSSDSEGGEENSFNDLMIMMMMQQKSNSEEREQEFQLHWEEMATACKEARD